MVSVVPGGEPAGVTGSAAADTGTGTPAGPSEEMYSSRVPLYGKVIIAVVALALLAWGSTTVYLHYNPKYAISPGDALNVNSLITVPAGKSHPVQGRVLMTDVYLQQVTALQLPGDLLDPNVDVKPAKDILGSSTPAQLQTQSAAEMNDSEIEAKVAALRHLGYSISETGQGTMVVSVQAGSPASHGLSPGDVVTAVDGTSVLAGADQFVSVVAGYHPGDTITLTVEKGIGGAQRTVPLTLGSRTVGGKVKPFVGVEITSLPHFQLPLTITINAQQIGGPSAGLAFAIGVLNCLSNGDITGGRTIAATGTIDPDGNVGAIGGLPQKAVAVRDAGATVFFVPKVDPSVPGDAADHRKAVQNAGSSVKVIQVSNLTEVLTDLQSMGGNLSGINIQPTPMPSAA